MVTQNVHKYLRHTVLSQVFQGQYRIAAVENIRASHQSSLFTLFMDTCNSTHGLINLSRSVLLTRPSPRRGAQRGLILLPPPLPEE